MLHGDRMLFYYHGLNYRSPETLLALGDKAIGAVGLATLPLDGFVSVDGAKGAESRDAAPYSELVTRSFGFTGSRLHVNVKAAPQGEAQAELRVEVVGAEPPSDRGVRVRRRRPDRRVGPGPGRSRGGAART